MVICYVMLSIVGQWVKMELFCFTYVLNDLNTPIIDNDTYLFIDPKESIHSLITIQRKNKIIKNLPIHYCHSRMKLFLTNKSIELSCLWKAAECEIWFSLGYGLLYKRKVSGLLSQEYSCVGFCHVTSMWQQINVC